MAENILDYIEAIQEYDSPGVCFTQSDTISVEGSTNEFRSSNADFLCFAPGDYFIVWGTKYNDGVYEKANDVNAYRLRAKSPISGETISLTSESCVDKIVVFNEVGAIGEASMVAEGPAANGSGVPGGIGQGQITVPTPEAYAMVGEAIGRCEAPVPTANVTALRGEQGSASITAPTPTTDAYIGNGGTCGAPAPTASATIEENVGDAEIEAPTPWASATMGEYTEPTVWGSADITAPPPVGVDFADASMAAPVPVAEAIVEAENHGKCYVPEPVLSALSIGNVAAAFAPNPTVSATGSSGAKATVIAPSPTIEAHMGAEGRVQAPAPTAKAYSGFPDYYYGQGDATVPSPTVEATASVPPKPQNGEASVTAPSPEIRASGLRHVLATGNVRVAEAIARGAAVTGVTGDGTIRIEESIISAEAVTEAIADGNMVIANAIVSATSLSSRKGTAILQYNEHDRNFVWEI